MEKKEFEKRPYEVPMLVCFQATVEKGFVGSPNKADGDFGHWDTETEWEEED